MYCGVIAVLCNIFFFKQAKEVWILGSAYEDAVGGTILSKQVLNGCPRIKLGLQSLALQIIGNRKKKQNPVLPTIYKSMDSLEGNITIYLLLLQFGKSSTLLAGFSTVLYYVVTGNG